MDPYVCDRCNQESTSLGGFVRVIFPSRLVTWKLCTPCTVAVEQEMTAKYAQPLVQTSAVPAHDHLGRVAS